MKLTRTRRLWWVIMHDEPREWPVWKPLQWLIPAGVLLWTAFVMVLDALGEL